MVFASGGKWRKAAKKMKKIPVERVYLKTVCGLDVTAETVCTV